VIILDHGRVIADGSVASLRAGSGDATLESVFQRLTAGEEVRERSGRILGAIGEREPGA
jgi:hypothetical protein